MPSRIRVAILEDHQSTLDGYYYRLGSAPQLEIVGAARTWSEFEALLAEHPADVALLDLSAPTAPNNPNSYPVFHALPALQQTYPGLDLLIISMHADPALIVAVLETGVSGYILKDDAATLMELAAVITSVASGGIVISENAFHATLRPSSAPAGPQLTARQREALSLSAAYPEATLAQLAERLGVMNSTARNLLSGAYLRLGVRNRGAAVAKARQLGLIGGSGGPGPNWRPADKP
jgi:DNA-binding NarL/FixJ family response regulator